MISENPVDFLVDFGSTATKNGSTSVVGVFDKAFAESFGMIAGNDPVFRCPTGNIARVSAQRAACGPGR